jgi:hypothetical protein
MTLTNHFNSKSRIKQREAVDSETFGDKSLSRFICAISVRRAQRAEKEYAIDVKPVVGAIRAPVIIRRGMNR